MNTSIITLTNGVKVANFSSPHSFTFEDGTILPAELHGVAEHYKVTFIENEIPNGNAGTTDIELTFALSPQVRRRIEHFMNMYHEGDVNIVICPLPMITCMRTLEYDIRNSPFRTIRCENRITKEISISKFCI